MALGRFSSFRHLRSELFLLSLCFFGWLIFLLCSECSRFVPGSVLLLFSSGASIVAMILLKLVGSPSPMRLIPRRSDFLAVLIAVPCGGLVQYMLIDSVLHVSLCGLTSLLLWSPLLATIAFGIFYAGMHSAYLVGHKPKVVLDILPEEASILKRELSALGLEEYFAFLSRAGLGEDLLKGRGSEIELVVISRGTVQQFDGDALLLRAHLEGIPIVDIQTLLADLTGRIALEQCDFWGYLTTATPQTPLLRAFWRTKVLVEPVLALLMGILALPMLLIIAALIKATSSGPVLYRQVRTGYLGRSFTLIKFRSMYTDAEQAGPQWSSKDDERVTALGFWLRRTRLDELPQLWNVIRGEMSFFGPRPERPEIYQQLKREIPLFSIRTVVRPGITGWAQVCNGYAATVDESRRKLEYDLYYIQHMSPRLDFIILIKTVSVLIFGETARPAQVQELAPQGVAEVSAS